MAEENLYFSKEDCIILNKEKVLEKLIEKL